MDGELIIDNALLRNLGFFSAGGRGMGEGNSEFLHVINSHTFILAVHLSYSRGRNMARGSRAF